MAYFTSIGFAGSLFPGVLYAQAATEDPAAITEETIRQAEAIAGLTFTADEREQMVRGLQRHCKSWAELRNFELKNSVPPALRFDPVVPGMRLPSERKPFRRGSIPAVQRPSNLEDVCFWPVTHLSELVRTGQVRPSELTEMYLGRLERHGPTLEAVVTLTEERARAQAKQMDAEIAAGKYRGPLHGIPWGAKDLFATKEYRTTWGAKPYEEQVLDMDATVVERLDKAGAILIAKLTLGALAQGDQWYGGMTRNPWKLEQGSSGSSAGPGAAIAAGLAGFSIGTETLGSIVSPSTRNGVTGLRPTYGRVSRHGAMALAWSMDKIGPMCRSVEDCALVLAEVIGPDGHDLSVRDVPFNWDGTSGIHGLRTGCYQSAFETSYSNKPFDERTLQVLRELGVDLIPMETPSIFPLDAMRTAILSTEAAAAFDSLTRSDKDDLIERSSWPNTFRTARFTPAVEYINANRIRSLVMEEMHKRMENLDVVISPTYGGNMLLLTNLTGHPAVTVPNGFREDGTPVSISFIGKLYGEAEVLAVAKAYQDATEFHRKHPPAFAPRS